MSNIRELISQNLVPSFRKESLEGIAECLFWSVEHGDDAHLGRCLTHCHELSRCITYMPSSKPLPSWNALKSLISTSSTCGIAGARRGLPSGFGVLFGLSRWSAWHLSPFLSTLPEGLNFICTKEWGSICGVSRFISEISYSGKLIEYPSDEKENKNFTDLLDKLLRSGIPYGPLFLNAGGPISSNLVWACHHMASSQGHAINGNMSQSEFFMNGAIRELKIK